MKKSKFLFILIFSFVFILGACAKQPIEDVSDNTTNTEDTLIEEEQTNEEIKEEEKEEIKDKTNVSNGTLKEEIVNKEEEKPEIDNDFNKQEYVVHEYDANRIWIKLSNYDYLNNGEKIVFLTFDDGPSVNTPSILDILDKNNIKATFFILGKNLEKQEFRDTLVKEYKSGHAIGNHTYTHNYTTLYPDRSLNLNNFLSEVNQTNDKLREVLGPDFSTRVVRCPGGLMSWKNVEPLKQHFWDNNLVSMDWNALSGDAEGQPKTKEELINNAITTSKNKEIVVLLMHDAKGKENTVEALQGIIDHYKSQGYTFKTLH